eukprot:13068936-Ditylum_brightwellii.AAC.1
MLLLGIAAIRGFGIHITSAHVKADISPALLCSLLQPQFLSRHQYLKNALYLPAQQVQRRHANVFNTDLHLQQNNQQKWHQPRVPFHCCLGNSSIQPWAVACVDWRK